MKRNVGFLFVLLILGISSINAKANYTLALSMLTNTAMVTAQNAAATATYQTNLTTATMYGGVMYIRSGPVTGVQAIGAYQRLVWSIQLSNIGNAQAVYMPQVKASNCRQGGGIWAKAFSNAGPLTIPAGGSVNFAFIISNKSPASNLAYSSYLIIASNRSAPQAARLYTGWGASSSNLKFGGTLASNTNVTGGAFTWGPIVALHHARTTSMMIFTNNIGMLQAYISGPVLLIKKQVVSIIHPSGLYAAGDLMKAEPGALITYRIWISNSGTAPATNAMVVDTIQTNFMGLVSILSQGRTFTNGLNALAAGNNKLIFRSTQLSNNKFTNQQADRIYIRVRVK